MKTKKPQVSGVNLTCFVALLQFLRTQLPIYLPSLFSAIFQLHVLLAASRLVASSVVISRLQPAVAACVLKAAVIGWRISEPPLPKWIMLIITNGADFIVS